MNKIAEMKFQVGELIICFLVGLSKRLFWCRWSDISRCLNAIRTHFLHPVCPKKRLGRIRGSDVLNRGISL
jgi:hypothetical protein